MKKLIILTFCIGVFSSCNKTNYTTDTNTTTDTIESTNFQMYQLSEMALLMEQMYTHNLQVKERILNNQDLGEYPKAFDKIHTAVLTDSTDRDEFFNEQAYKYIEAQKAIYEATDRSKENFNKMVNQCLECHAKKCGGPIPRIKKLLIPEL